MAQVRALALHPSCGIEAHRCAGVHKVNDTSSPGVARPFLIDPEERLASQSGWVFKHGFPVSPDCNHQSGDAPNWPGTPIAPVPLSLLVMVILSDPGESEIFRLLKMPLISLRSSET